MVLGGGSGAFASSGTASSPIGGINATLIAPASVGGHSCGTGFCGAPFKLTVSVSGYGVCEASPHQTESGTCFTVDQVRWQGSPSVAPSSPDAGLWCTSNTSSNCLSEATSQAYSFGWQRSAGRSPTVTATVTGTGYQASHLGWDRVGTWSAKATIRLVPGPVQKTPQGSLAVSVSTALGGKPLGIGSETDATVKVTAVGEAVSGISLGNGLEVSSKRAKISSSPSGLAGFALAKGASRSFVFKLAGVSAGPVTLKAAAVGKSSAGKTVRGSDSAALTVAGQLLAVSFETTPKQLTLKLGKNSLLEPGQVTVKVSLTNTSTETFDHVQLLTLGAEPVDLTQRLDPVRLPPGSVPAKFPGSFPPRSHASRTFTLKVTGDGEYQFRALALYNDAHGGNGRVVGIGGRFEAIAPLLAFSTDLHRDNISHRNGADWVKGGQSWYVGGHIKNLSSTKSLCIAPLAAQADGNAASVGLQDVATYNVNSAEPPFAGLLKPGQSLPLGMAVVTGPMGTAQGSIDVPVKAFLAAPDATCELEPGGGMVGAGNALTAAQTDIPAGSTSFVVHVDLAPPPAPKAVTAGGLEFFGLYAKTSFDFYANTALGLAALARSLGTPEHYRKAVLGFGVYDPVEAANVIGQANAEIMSTARLLVNFMQTATPAQKQAVYDFAAQAAARLPNAAYAKLGDEIEAAGKQWFGKFLAAVESGDADQIWTEFAGLAGRGAGELNAIWLQLFLEGAGTQLAANSTELQAAAKASTSAPEVLTSSRGVAASRVLKLPELANVWGFPKPVVDSLNSIAKKFDVLIGARSRQAISIKLEQLGAVWKNSNFHQKTVSAIDRLYLRMGPIQQGLLGSRSFTAAGTSQAINEIRAAGLPAAEEAEALARLADRIHENDADLAKLKKLATTKRRACSTCPETEGWVNAGFNANESGEIAASTSVSRWRRFKLVETPITSADGHTVLGTLYEPFEENVQYAAYPKLGKKIPELCREALGTVLCPITGDIDLVYVTDLLGRSLGPALMRSVFSALEEAGFAHTDLVTWYDEQEGAFFFPGKEKQLENLTLGKDSTVQFSPDAVNRATYLAPMNQSISTGPNSYQLTIIGGQNPTTR